MWGFETLKDFLQVLLVPIILFALGTIIPRRLESQKRKNFLSLIKLELDKMEPIPRHKDDKNKEWKWHQHLKKRFIHEQIFESPSRNRDFILTLPPDFAYNEAQLWIHHEKATTSTGPALAEEGASWCDSLKFVCSFFDGKESGKFYDRVYAPWEKLVLSYHPDLQTTGRLVPGCRDRANGHDENA